MKKIIIGLLILAGAVFVWVKLPHKASVPLPVRGISPDEILSNDYQKIIKHLKPENIAGDEWKKINDYALPVEKLVNTQNAAKFFKTANDNIPGIFSCLKKDFCEMETRNDNDAYFDEQRTPAHILLNRNLSILKESLKKDSSLKSQVDWELMSDLANSGAEILAVNAIDIIREFGEKNAKADNLIKLAQNYKGEARADALARIAKSGSSQDKILLANEIEDIFNDGDANTAISVLEKLKGMGLNRVEMFRILSRLCRFRDDETISHNWGMVKTEANRINPEFEKNCN